MSDHRGTATPDRVASDIAAWLPLFLDPGDRFEVRAIYPARKARSGRGEYEPKVAGYWSADSVLSFAHAAAGLDAAARDLGLPSGVYFTPHRLKPESTRGIGRPAGLVTVGKGHVLTGDGDVAGRRFLLIDVDPFRPGKLSATDAERAAASRLAERVRRYFEPAGWPAPTVIDSGNGVHLYYRLPADEPGGPRSATTDPIARVLAGLAARFDTTEAAIDTTVYNPARIMQLPGTTARKGPEAADRLHRRSWMVEASGAETNTGTPLLTLADDLKPVTAVAVGAAGPSFGRPDLEGGEPDAVGLPPMARRVDRARRYLSEIPAGTDGAGGSKPMFWAARVLIHAYMLDPHTATVLLADYGSRCDPPWTDAKQLEHKINDAATKPFGKPRGWVYMDDDRRSPPATNSAPSPASPEAGDGAVSPLCPEAERAAYFSDDLLKKAHDKYRKATDGHRLAYRFLLAYHVGADYTVRFRGKQCYRWLGPRWELWPDAELDQQLTADIDKVFRDDHAALLEKLKAKEDEGKQLGDDEDEKPPPPIESVTLRNLSETAKVLGSVTRFRSRIDPPAWFEDSPVPPQELFAAANGLAHLPRYAAGDPAGYIPHTPRFFNLSAADYEVTAEAPPPAEWLKFLAGVWPNDPDSIALLQEWFGYLLLPDNRMQKMLLQLGATRSGKGTTLGVIKGLVGRAGYQTFELASLDGPFAFANFPGKLVAVEEDAKVQEGGKVNWGVVASRLKTISGSADGIFEVNQKGTPQSNMLIPVRFVMAANDVPAIPDASAALARRYCILRYETSHLGSEDLTLLDRLLAELPGIFNWSVEGWKRLRDRGRFTEPASAVEARADMLEGTSPAARFVSERCELGKELKVVKAEILKVWAEWWQKQRFNEPLPAASKFQNWIQPVVALGVSRPRVDGDQVAHHTGIALKPMQREFWDNDQAPHERAADATATDEPNPPTAERHGRPNSQGDL